MIKKLRIVGKYITHLQIGDRVVVPYFRDGNQISKKDRYILPVFFAIV